MYLFLQSWNLVPPAQAAAARVCYLPLLDEGSRAACAKLAQHLRAEGWSVRSGLEPERMGKALEFANKNAVPYVVIVGENERARGVFARKNMQSGQQEEVAFSY
jgi:histidyl-tRNA synthetase